MRKLPRPNKSLEPTAVQSARSFGAQADGAFVSRHVGIPVAGRRWFSFLRYVYEQFDTTTAWIVTGLHLGFGVHCCSGIFFTLAGSRKRIVRQRHND